MDGLYSRWLQCEGTNRKVFQVGIGHAVDGQLPTHRVTADDELSVVEVLHDMSDYFYEYVRRVVVKLGCLAMAWEVQTQYFVMFHKLVNERSVRFDKIVEAVNE